LRRKNRARSGVPNYPAWPPAELLELGENRLQILDRRRIHQSGVVCTRINRSLIGPIFSVSAFPASVPGESCAMSG